MTCGLTGLTCGVDGHGLQVRQLRWQVQQNGKGGAAGGGVPPSGGRAASAAGRNATSSPAKGGRWALAASLCGFSLMF